jgi:hypothetical protein
MDAASASAPLYIQGLKSNPESGFQIPDPEIVSYFLFQFQFLQSENSMMWFDFPLSCAGGLVVVLPLPSYIYIILFPSESWLV